MLIHEVDSQSTNFSCFLLKKLNWFPYHLEFDFYTQSLCLQQGDTCMLSSLASAERNHWLMRSFERRRLFLQQHTAEGDTKWYHWAYFLRISGPKARHLSVRWWFQSRSNSGCSSLVRPSLAWAWYCHQHGPKAQSVSGETWWNYNLFCWKIGLLQYMIIRSWL